MPHVSGQIHCNCCRLRCLTLGSRTSHNVYYVKIHSRLVASAPTGSLRTALLSPFRRLAPAGAWRFCTPQPVRRSVGVLPVSTAGRTEQTGAAKGSRYPRLCCLARDRAVGGGAGAHDRTRAWPVLQRPERAMGRWRGDAMAGLATVSHGRRIGDAPDCACLGGSVQRRAPASLTWSALATRGSKKVSIHACGTQDRSLECRAPKTPGP